MTAGEGEGAALMIALGRDSGWVKDNCLVMGGGTKAGTGTTDGWTAGWTGWINRQMDKSFTR